MISNILAISALSLKESIRSRLFAGLLVFLALFLLFSIYISTLSLGTVARFLQNTGMLGISMACLAVCILFGLHALYGERDRHELYVIMNRVPRPSYLLGRYLGTVYVIAIVAVTAGLSVFMLTLIIGKTPAPHLLWAVYWAVLEYSLLSAVGVLFYTLGVGFSLNALLVIAVYVLGHSMNEAIQSLLALGTQSGPGYLIFVKSVSFLFPNFDMFDFRLAIVHGEHVPAGRVFLASLYGLLYAVALLGASAACIQKRDL